MISISSDVLAGLGTLTSCEDSDQLSAVSYVIRASEIRFLGENGFLRGNLERRYHGGIIIFTVEELY